MISYLISLPTWGWAFAAGVALGAVFGGALTLWAFYSASDDDNY